MWFSCWVGEKVALTHSHFCTPVRTEVRSEYYPRRNSEAWYKVLNSARVVHHKRHLFTAMLLSAACLVAVTERVLRLIPVTANSRRRKPPTASLYLVIITQLGYN